MSVLNPGSPLMDAGVDHSRVEPLGARVQTQSWSGHSHNGFLVFDYVDADNYKYAGMLDGANKWVIGERVAGR